ncbi:MAG: hypothetical protein AB7P69_20485 [Candidatus Binatia bacterium]
MFPLLSSSGAPSYVLNMTADFTPLFTGLVVILGLSLLGIAFVIGAHDIREKKQHMHAQEDRFPTLPKAA